MITCYGELHFAKIVGINMQTFTYPLVEICDFIRANLREIN
jgi:hypothetical protein